MRRQLRFSLSTFPDARNIQSFVGLIVVGIACLIVMTTLSDLLEIKEANFLDLFNKGDSLSKITKMVSRYELDDFLSGRFRSSTNQFDFRENFESTYFAARILASPLIHSGLRGRENTKKFVREEEKFLFGGTTEGIFQGVTMMKLLDLLDSSMKTKYYEKIMALAEKSSGFRPDPEHSASVRSTYYALRVIEELGMWEEFKATDELNDAMHFVSSQKSPVDGGFSDTVGINSSSIAATYFALELLPPKSHAGVEFFVHSCQRSDGGFAPSTPSDPLDLHYGSSHLVTSIQGLHLLHVLGLDSSGWLESLVGSRYGMASSFIRSNIKNFDLEAAHYFIFTASRFDSFNFGSPVFLNSSLFSLAMVFFLAALIVFYKFQFPEEALRGAKKFCTVNLILLISGAFSLFHFPLLSMVIYVIFGSYLCIHYYEANKIDTTHDGLMMLLACINSVCYFVAAFFSSMLSPFIFLQPSFWALQFFVFIAITFLSSYFAGMVTSEYAKQRLLFFVNAGKLAWITNTLVIFYFLQSRGDLATIYRISISRGTFPAIFVAFPFMTLLSSYFFSSIGYLLFAAK